MKEIIAKLAESGLLTTVITLIVVALVFVVLLIVKGNPNKPRKAVNAPKKAANTEGGQTPADGGKGALNSQNTAQNGKKKTRGLKKVSSTQSLSPILDIQDGIIIGKDERFYKLLEFAPINFELRSPSEQAQIIDQFSSALRTWPDLVHLKIVSTRSNVEPYIEGLTKRRAEEEAAGNLGCVDLIDDQLNLISAIGKTQGVSRRFFITIEYTNDSSGLKRRPPFEEIAATLNRQARGIAAAMESCGNLLVSNDSRDYIQEAIFSMLCKEQADFVPYEERKEAILTRYTERLGTPVDERMIPVNDFICPDRIDTTISPKYVVIDGKYITYCYLPSSAYPVRAYGGWLQVLFGYMDGVDVDFWIKREDIERIQRRLQYELKNNKIRENNTEDISQDYEDVQSAVQSGYYLKSAIANGDDFCYMATMLTITADSLEELEIHYQEMRNHMIRNDMQLRRCLFQQEEAFVASFPLTDYCKSIFEKSKRNITSSQLGSCYPFTAYELADKGGVLMGINARYGSPVWLNTFDTTKYQSANGIILGPSGSGKTYLLLSTLLRLRQNGLQIYAIAPLKGHEFRRAVTAVGGEYIRIAPGSDQNINIMEIRKADHGDSSAVEYGEKGSLLSKKIQQILSFFSILLPDMNETEKQLLDECLKNTYQKFGITEKNKSLIDNVTRAYKTMPTLADLHKELGEAGADAKRLYTALARYVTGSAKNFSMPTNVNVNNKFVVIDVSDLTAEMLPVGMFITLDLLLDLAKQDITKRKVIAIDEMWRLMKASRQSAEFVEQVYREIRGYAGACLGATQDLQDILADEIGSAVINNARFKFVLPLEKKEADALANVIDLTTEELNQLKKTNLKAGGGGRRKALLIANNNHVFISVEATRKEHDLITTNAEDLKQLAAERTSRETI